MYRKVQGRIWSNEVISESSHSYSGGRCKIQHKIISTIKMGVSTKNDLKSPSRILEKELTVTLHKQADSREGELYCRNLHLLAYIFSIRLRSSSKVILKMAPLNTTFSNKLECYDSTVLPGYGNFPALIDQVLISFDNNDHILLYSSTTAGITN